MHNVMQKDRVYTLQTLTLEFLVTQHLDAAAMHTLGRLTACATRLDRILVQIIGQPAEIAIADERITRQMPATSRKE